jgi:hypothetical protein
MKIELPFAEIDWDRIDKEEHPGASGSSWWRVHESGSLRVRMIEYSNGFVADHWCGLGHVVLLLEGEATIELEDGRSFDLRAGAAFLLGDGERNRHRLLSASGARAFIVDGF